MIHIPENKRNVPSLFTCLDGTEVKTAEDWTGKRRPEILGILRKEEYGWIWATCRSTYVWPLSGRAGKS